MIIGKYFSCSYGRRLPFSWESIIRHNVCNFSLHIHKKKTFNVISRKLKFWRNSKCLSSCSKTSTLENVSITTREPDFKEKLLKWAIQFKVSHVAFSRLLKILSQNGIENIPITSATLMKEKEKKIKVNQMLHGVYVHYSLEKSLKEIILTLNKKNLQINKNINLSIFIDHLSLNVAKNEGIWAILGSLDMKETIFLIGAFMGQSRPDDANSFLCEFVEEAKALCSTGLLLNNFTYNVAIKKIICDAPAKAFILNIKSFSGYSSCTKCTAQGEYLRNKVCFPEKSEKRTEEHFHSQIFLKGKKSKLLEIPNFSVTHNMPLDYFHVVCFGVLNKLLKLWIDKEKYWISKSEFDKKHNTINEAKPVEFKTKQKPLHNYSKWNMFECREFFLYYMPFFLKNCLHNKYFENFLYLYSACRLFSTTASQENATLGEQMLNDFVETFKTLYGKENMSYNIHNLYHLADDYKLHGPLDDFSSAHFEKYLIKLRNIIKKTKKKSFPQIVLNYSQDLVSYSSLNKIDVNEPKVKKKLKVKNDTFLLWFNVSEEYKELHLNYKKIIPNNQGDKYVILKDGKIVEVANIVKTDGIQLIVGREFLTYKDFWEKPIKSSELKIFKVSSLSRKKRVWKVNEISKKCLSFPLNDKDFLIVPMLENDY